jgi:nitrous oxide reductase accessory protein NosL
MIDRRRFVLAMAMTPLAAALAACGKKGSWADGMAEIKWDRDTCARCSMAISDRRFAAEIVGGPQAKVFKFDDIGCVSFFIRDKVAEMPWLAEAATRLWVADMTNQGEAIKWLDARTAHYISKASPMAYNYAAVSHPQAMSVDFETMRQHVLAKGK